MDKVSEIVSCYLDKFLRTGNTTSRGAKDYYQPLCKTPSEAKKEKNRNARRVAKESKRRNR